MVIYKMYDLHVNILPMKYPLVMYVHFDAQYTVKAAQWYVTKKLVLLYKKKGTEMIYFLSQISWLIIGLLDLVEKTKTLYLLLRLPSTVIPLFTTRRQTKACTYYNYYYNCWPYRGTSLMVYIMADIMNVVCVFCYPPV